MRTCGIGQGKVVRLGLLGVWLAWGGAVAAAEDAELAREDRIQELERKVEVLTEELTSVRSEILVPEEKALKSAYGLGPAASKVYGVTKGLSLGGYAEGFYRNFVSEKTRADRDRSDLLRVVLYAGYKFTDRILFNSEIEYEHASTSATESAGGGSVSVELAQLDFLWREWANFRTGLLLMPVGFLNEIHEPPFFHGVGRPEVEQTLIPSTWRESGVGVFGRLGERVEYRFYSVTGLNARGFRPSGFRATRQHGNRSLAEDLGVVARLDTTPLPGLLVGGSLYSGKSSQDERAPSGLELPEARLTLWELHSQYRTHGLELRGLFSMAHLEDAADLTRALRPSGLNGLAGFSEIGAQEVIGKRMLGGYVEVAYDVLPWLLPDTAMYLAPFLRLEYLDTHERVPSGFSADGAQELHIVTPGLSFKPHPNVVLKLDYRNLDTASQSERADEVNFGFGVAF